MKNATGCLFATLLVALTAIPAGAAPYLEEHVTGGALDLTWINGYDTPNNMQPATLAPDHVAFANPSGDHTVAVATNAATINGGLIVTTVDAQGVDDYQWEGWVFTGDGNTRRGLIFRATPADNVKTFYMFVLESGLLRLRMRKLVAPSQISTIVGEWFTTSLPGGLPAVNTWHHMKVSAIGNQFQLFWDGVDVNAGPVIDASGPLLTGNVGAYNFSATSGEVPVYFDDLALTSLAPVPAARTTWGAIKNLYR
jgi:hypothetical protein